MSVSAIRSVVLILLLLLVPTPVVAQAPSPPTQSATPVVQGVLFFSPTCPHCEAVIADDLPGIFEGAGGAPSLSFDEEVAAEELSFFLMSNGTLQLLLVDVSAQAGNEMFVRDSERLGLPQAGVPRLDIGDDFYVGSIDIPAALPRIIEAGLAADGVSWPPLPGLDTAIAPIDDAAVATDMGQPDGDTEDGAALAASLDATPLDRIGRDPLGNSISILVLVVLIGSLVAIPVLALRGSLRSGPRWLVPILLLVGIGVAAYLATIETTGSEAVCGPVGDCNAVQASEYAFILGIPVGVLGVAGYIVIGGLWALARVAHGRAADSALVGIAGAALVGTVFSAYLTFLEPFVIGATCMWCITSALVMLGLLWASAADGWAALGRIRGGRGSTGHAAGGRASPSAAVRP